MLLEVVRLCAVYKSDYADVTAVKDLSFSLQEKEVLGLIGESGSGKSTVSWALLGLLGELGGKAFGTCTFQGVTYDLQNSDALVSLRWQKIAVVPQSAMSSFNPVYTIGYSLTEILKQHLPELSERERMCRADSMLAKVELDPKVYYSYPHELSGGMRQRAALAKALLCRPSLLILDEATTGLDVITEGNILKTVMDIKEELGMSLLFITHDLRLVKNICDNSLVLKDGIKMHPESPYCKKLFASIPDIKQEGKIVHTPESQAPVLEVKGLLKRFKKPGSRQMFTALNRVGFSLHPGKVTGLVGASGSGKTTILNILYHLLNADDGIITFKGNSIPVNNRLRQNIRRKMGLVRQDPYDSLPPHQKVAEIVCEPLTIHGLSQGKQSDREKVCRSLRDVGLDPEIYAGRYPHQMSGGQRQRIAIARALITDPVVLALDEPTSMLDMPIKKEMLQLVSKQAKNKKIAVFLVTHDLAAASTICDELLVLQGGTIVESGSLSRLIDESENLYFKQLLLAATDLKTYWSFTDVEPSDITHDHVF